MNISRGKQDIPIKTVVYGPEGIGKSTFASQFPNPLFSDTEGSTARMDVARFDSPSSYTMIMNQIDYVIKNKPCRTYVLDTADWAEKLVKSQITSNANVKSIESFGYGKGYTYLEEEFGRLLNKLSEVIEVGIHVVMVAHATLKKFEQPDELGSYDKWELKLEKKTAPLLKEWADMILFANYKTYVVNVDGQGAAKGKNKVQGGHRVMYTTHHPCWDAKNRFDLPEELEFKFSEIAHLFNSAPAQTGSVPSYETQVSRPSIQETAADKESVPVQDQVTVQEKVQNAQAPETQSVNEIDQLNIPRELKDLMKNSDVKPWEIQAVVAARGYFPEDTPLDNYPNEFIQGVLVGAWEQVYGYVEKLRESTPF